MSLTRCSLGRCRHNSIPISIHRTDHCQTCVQIAVSCYHVQFLRSRFDVEAMLISSILQTDQLRCLYPSTSSNLERNTCLIESMKSKVLLASNLSIFCYSRPEGSYLCKSAKLSLAEQVASYLLRQNSLIWVPVNGQFPF